jgi:hypothetical protein
LRRRSVPVARCASVRLPEGQQALVTLNERKSRYSLIAQVPFKTASVVADTMISVLTPFAACVHTLTIDKGKEFAQHERIATTLDAQFFFAIPTPPGNAVPTRTGALRDRLHCTVVMHELDAWFVEVGDDEVSAASWYGSELEPCVIDRQLAGHEEEIRLGDRSIRAVHIPGHSRGSVAYVATSAGVKIVFAQDVHGPLHQKLLSNAADYQASLQRLIDLDADILCEGHFGIYKGRQEIVRFVSSFMH